MQLRKNLIKDAAFDLRFLLNRNYKKKGALQFIANKYLLSIDERNYLARCVFSDSKSVFRKNKLVNLPEIGENSVFVDGYNVLITVENICRKDYENLILCDDGIIRDLNAVFGKYKFNDMTELALNNILALLKEYNPLKIEFFFDKQVSFSGKLGNLTKKLINFKGINGEVILSKNVDFEIIKKGITEKGIVATSDGIIMDKVERVIDLPFYLSKKSNEFLK